MPSHSLSSCTCKILVISNKITVIQQQQQKKDKDKDKGKIFQPSGNLLVGIQGPCPSTVKQKGLATTG